MAFCKNCAQSIDSNAAVCMSCGFAAGTGQNFCSNCGKETTEGAAICTSCGFAIQGGPVKPPDGQEQKSKMTAGLLGIFLGGFGVHNFYLGRMLFAIIQASIGGVGILLICCTGGISVILTVGSGIWGLIEGIMILTGSIDKDGNGNPLKE